DLRDGYRWKPRNSNDRIGVWVRGDGRYADLGQFFVSDFAEDTLRGDPGAELSYSDRTNGRDAFTGDVNGPLVALGVNVGATDICEYQIHQMDELYQGTMIDAPVYTSADERFFVDTDGDLRPDARWQVLDSLDGLLGLRWVAAARIIDNSALVNLNTAMEFQDPADPTRVGDGRTPADVDLVRLMRTAHLAPDLT